MTDAVCSRCQAPMDTGAGACHICGATQRSAIIVASVVAEDAAAGAKSAVGRPAESRETSSAHRRRDTGDRSAAVTGAAADVHSAATPIRQVVDNRWCVLGLLFLVMAVLGLPILWASRAFSRPAKVGLTVLVIVYTALLAWLCWLAVQAAYHEILDAIRSGGLG